MQLVSPRDILVGAYTTGRSEQRNSRRCSRMGLSGFVNRPELGIEPSEVQVVKLSQLSSVRGVHLVEPVDQLVGDVITERVVELLGQRGRHRHRALLSHPATI